MQSTVLATARATALVALLVLAPGCTQDSQDTRDAYCSQVKKDGAALTRAADTGGPGAILTVLPTLEALGAQAPDDLKDEWQTYLNALRGWRDALAESGLSADDVANGVPKGLARADRQRVLGAVTVLQSAEVVTASQGIEQQALDVCGTPLL